METWDLWDGVFRISVLMVDVGMGVLGTSDAETPWVLTAVMGQRQTSTAHRGRASLSARSLAGRLAAGGNTNHLPTSSP